ncbi:MAG TPA: asparagine synthase (glutamine-hydrolyzing) [Caldimonas sp.]|nr:asparagine synthase (glutamine-hydrolyzing) [Caldimonas sp.]
MCGIAGILTSGRALDDRAPVLEEMMRRLAHRGPDGEGRVHHPRMALIGHRRLAIIDIAHGQQPMCSPDGRYTLTYNGEIYNYVELRQSLVQRGIVFETFSDTEVLFRLLVHEGAAGIRRLNGMFAFVFHDREDNSWIAARDPFGIKPLYHARAGDELVFASEIKALFAHPGLRPQRDDVGLNQYLTFQFCLHDRTLFAGVRKLQPGTFMRGRGAEILEERTYWDTDYRVDAYHTEEYFVDRLRALLEDSVRLQIRSDVPLGGYLSGGLDSSVVCMLASQRLDAPMPVFHGRFAEGPAYDESAYARLVASEIAGEYHEVVPTAQDFVRDLPVLVHAMDEPVAGPGLFPQYRVSRRARERVTVVLGGQGGDEIFAGYARYLVGYLEQALKGAIFETNEEGRHLVTLESIIPQLPMLKDYRPLLAQFLGRGLFDDMDARYFHLIDRSQDLATMLSGDALRALDRPALFAEFQRIFNHPDTKSYINKMTHFDQKTLLPALLQVEDRVSMAVSLESRVPLLDTRIVDLVTTMAPPLKFQGGRPKHVLKRAVRTLLPASVLERKDKMGFPVPIAEWMRGGPVRDFVGDVLQSRCSIERGIFRPDALEALLSRQGVGGRQLWGALCLELWHRQFIDGG